MALAQYPQIRISDEQVREASAAITLARTAWLPRVDALAQANRATRNNVYGLLLPQSTLPNISGPPNPVNDMTSVWGSAVGFLVSWEPFDFGTRTASVAAAEAGRRRSEARVERTRFEVAALTADAYLTALAARQTILAAEAQVTRSRQIGDVVRALAKAELRPGADVSRNEAELATAEIQVINAQNALAAARTTLEKLTGRSIDPVEFNSPPADLSGASPEPTAPFNTTANPYAREQQASVAEAEARRRIIERAWYPKFNVQGASYARGTGAVPDGRTLGGVNGLGPNIYNYALGLTVTFPLFELPSLRARREIVERQRLTEQARYDQLLLELKAQMQRATDQLETARRVSSIVPRQLEAARVAEAQAGARYKAGLATLVEVADAQRVLTQSEIDASLARLNVWRAMLQVAAAAGDLKPFLDKVQ
jgi:outer membrane protein